MSFRVFKGNVLSLNGWRMCNPDECVWVTIRGSNNVSILVRKGIPAIILPAFLARFNEVIEPLRDADTACWTLDNDVATSQHPAGVAADANWGSHPFHAYGTYGDKLPALRHLLDVEFKGCVGWGGDWGGNPQDEMHFEIAFQEGYLDDNGNFVLDVDQRLIDLAAEIQASQPPQPPVDKVAILADAMGNRAGVDYASKLAAVTQCLNDCSCTTVERIAMWCGQIGEESGGLQWMEEIADGSEYEGRSDLGNTQPGDGPRFKGRGPIQVTGRRNYTVLSQWAFDQGLVPDAAFFVDAPMQLASDQYGFIGVTWYWTTQRPMNDAADARDIVAATKYVNGGTHGLQDRTDRWNHCLAMGDRLLALTTEDWLNMPSNEEKLDFIYNELSKRAPSRAIFADNPAWGETLLGYVYNGDANTVNVLIVLGALAGDATCADHIRRVAKDGPLAGTYAAGVPSLVTFGQELAQAVEPLIGSLKPKTTKAVKK